MKYYKSFKKFLHYSIIDINRNSDNYKLGFITILIVISYNQMIFFVIIMVPFVNMSNISFQNILQYYAGDQDFILSADSKSHLYNQQLYFSQQQQNNTNNTNNVFNYFLNQSQFYINANQTKYQNGISSRLYQYGNISYANNQIQVLIIILNTTKQNQIGIGRKLDLDYLKSNNVYLSKDIAQILNVQLQNEVKINIDILQSFSKLLNVDAKNTIKQYITNNLNIPQIISISYLDQQTLKMIKILYPQINQYLISNNSLNISKVIDNFILNISNMNLTQIKVTKIIENPKGIYQISLGNVILLDLSFMQKFFKLHLKQRFLNLQGFFNNFQILKNLTGNFTFQKTYQQIQLIKLKEYSMFLVTQIKNRLQTYLSQSPNKLLTNAANQLFLNSTVDANIQTPLILASQCYYLLLAYGQIKIYSTIIIINTCIIFAFLGIYLAYSILLSKIKKKTYDYAVFRLVGAQKKDILLLVLISSIIISVPGIILSLMLLFLIRNFILMFYLEQSKEFYPITIPYYIIIICILLGIIGTFIAHYFPIKNVLGKKLRDALDIFFRELSDIQIYIYKLQQIGISITTTIIAILLFIISFVTYYIVPLLIFIYNDVQTFNLVINALLFIYLIGIMCILVLFQYPLEKLMLNIISLCSVMIKKLSHIIYKNLNGHRQRNSKIAFLYSMLYAFIIYSKSSLDTNFYIQIQLTRLNNGADIVVKSKQLYGLDEKKLTQALNSIQNKQILNGFSFVSAPFNVYGTNTILIHPSKFSQQINSRLVSITGNFLQSTYKQLILEYQYGYNVNLNNIFEKLSEFKVIKEGQLVDNQNLFYNSDKVKYKGNYLTEIPIILPSSFRTQFLFDINSYINIFLTTGIALQTKVIGLFNKLPSFGFSSFSSSSNQAIISQQVYMQLFKLNLKYLNSTINNKTITTMTKQWPFQGTIKDRSIKYTLLLKTNNPNQIISIIKPILSSSDQITITKTLVDNMKQNLQNINILTFVIMVMSLILLLFLLYVTSVENISDSSKEIIIWRAIGLNSKKIRIAFLVENMLIIISSFIVGLLSGLCLTLIVAKLNYFTYEIPFNLFFPYQIIIPLFIGSILLGIFITYKSFDPFFDKTIAQLNRINLE